MIQRTVKVIIALSLLLAAPAIQAECQPSLIGTPCAYGGIAGTSRIEPGITLAAGNPIHLATGNKYQQEIDLPPNPALRGLELIRHYNAMDVRTSVLGRGWTLSYDTQLHRVASGWQIVQADGGRIAFPDSSQKADKTYQTANGTLLYGDDHYDWNLPTGSTLRFDQGGKLTTIQWPNGESLYIVRHTDADALDGHIHAVHNSRGRSLIFHYDVVDRQVRLVAVDTPWDDSIMPMMFPKRNPRRHRSALSESAVPTACNVIICMSPPCRRDTAMH